MLTWLAMFGTQLTHTTISGKSGKNIGAAMGCFNPLQDHKGDPMRKIIITILAVLSLACFALAYGFQQVQIEEQYWRNLGKGSQSFELYLPQPKRNEESIVSQLIIFGSKYQGNIYKTDILLEKKKPLLVKSIFLSYETKGWKELPLLKGRSLTVMDMKEKNVLLTSALKPGEQTRSVGTLYSFCSIGKVRIQPLALLPEREGLGVGTYTVELKNPEQKGAFLQELSVAFGLDSIELTQPRSMYATSNNFYVFLPLFLGLSGLLLFFLSMIHFLVLQSRSIGIAKLLGQSNGFLWRILMSPIFFAQFIILGGILAGLRVFIQAPQSVLQGFLITGLLVIFGTFIISFVFLGMIRKYRIVDLLKNRKPMRLLFLVNLSLRFFMLVGVLLFSYGIGSGFLEVYKEYRIVDKWSQYGNRYGVLESKLTEEDHSDLMQNTHFLEQKYFRLFADLNSMGALYTRIEVIEPLVYFRQPGATGEASTFIPDFSPEWVGSYKEMTLMTVNINYLQEFMKEKSMDFPEEEKRGIFLLPDSFKKDEAALRKILIAYQLLWNSFESIITGEATKSREEEIIIAYYPMGFHPFSFDTRVKDEEEYTLKEPIFRVITEGNAGYQDRSFLVGAGVNSSIKIPLLKGDTKAAYMRLVPILKERGLKNNLTSIRSISEVFKEKIETLRFGLLLMVGGCGLLLLLTSVISLRTIDIRMEMLGRRLGVMKILGYSQWASYRRELWLFSILWLFQVLATIPIAWSNPLMKPIALIVVIPIMALDWTVLLISIHRRHRKNTSKGLRSDE